MSTSGGLHRYLQPIRTTVFPMIWGFISEPKALKLSHAGALPQRTATKVLLESPEHLHYACDHIKAVDLLQTHLQWQKLPNFWLTKRKSYYPVGKYIYFRYTGTAQYRRGALEQGTEPKCSTISDSDIFLANRAKRENFHDTRVAFVYFWTHKAYQTRFVWTYVESFVHCHTEISFCLVSLSFHSPTQKVS